ncbi:Tyrosine-protein kinase Abl [Eumeta japonica]|uniref:Tyrosine-protein kinase Abl n=1 Tax=Eumeta variegata TaxID=151549 RepID=A0A4C1THJ0_EUMVA|nr:Tyrosine-protein kinase Abl [Eumeta japonica]
MTKKGIMQGNTGQGSQGNSGGGGGNSGGGGLTIRWSSRSASQYAYVSQGKGNVQMRRTTNKQGKQAPAPPKRTSRDSTYRDEENAASARQLIDEMHTNENDNATGDPDTDHTGDSLEQNASTHSKMQHSMHVANNLAPRGAQTHSSFKRTAPVMGNRGLETRQSKRSQHVGRTDTNTAGAVMNQINPVAQPIQVGALEVMNVKRVVNRYGTCQSSSPKRNQPVLANLEFPPPPLDLPPPPEEFENIPPPPPPQPECDLTSTQPLMLS